MQELKSIEYSNDNPILGKYSFLAVTIFKNSVFKAIILQYFVSQFIIFCCLFAPIVFADSPVWKISKNNQTLYLGGTIHILKPSDYPLPIAFAQAYEAAEVLIFEADLNEMDNPNIQQQLLQKLLYPKGQSLQTQIGQQTWQKLKQFMQTYQLEIPNIQQIKPPLLALSLMMQRAKQLGLTAQGIDLYYLQQSLRDGKTVNYLETIEQQIEFISSLAEEDADEFILNTLTELETIDHDLRKTVQAWRRGDFAELNTVLIQPMQQHYPKIYQRLLKQRNDAWLLKIEQYLQTEAVEFILVGALHLAGTDGLLQQLLAKGYQLDAVSGSIWAYQ